ncbi:AMP-dependent synthetase/ligase [Penicillium brevicompactum]|uniref:AMP-dependent synthetase/ligase n=1 Tax=Penicillium brevicompactum TaxID=5074 RepID=A0A9W9Q9N4_PENBR|nr:AMP-dependent synthetase/ligase [Penicillium brevicompactum]
MAVYRSSYPDLDIQSIDLVSYLFSNPFNTPLDRPLYVDAFSGKQYTFGDVIQRTRSLSNGLRQNVGVKPNDVVAFFSPNSIEYPIICHALIGSRAIASPTSAALTALELNAQLKTSGARFVIVHSSLLQTAQNAVKGTSVERIVMADGDSFEGQPTCEKMASTFAPTEFLTVDPAEASRQPTFNMTSNLQQWRSIMLESGELSQRPTRSSAIGFLPFSHIYGLNLFICQCLIWGTTVVVMPKFDLDAYLGYIQQYRPDELSIVPPIALMLVKDPRVAKYDLSCVRKIMSAAAPLTIELSSALEAKFKELWNTEVFCTQCWGLTETSPLATAIPNDRLEKRLTGVGCIVPNMEFRFVDPDTMKDAEVNPTGSTQPAEIWVRGPNVVLGYYNNEEATKSSYHIDEDGKRWFRTGDIGTIDPEGYVSIHDRIKEMIKYKGLQVIPSELEGKLIDHPDVEDAAVVGKWVDERATELPVGFLVLSRAAKERDEKTVIAGINTWLNERVANHKRLRGGIHLLAQIPKSPSGKILRREVKELLKSKAPKARL